LQQEVAQLAAALRAPFDARKPPVIAIVLPASIDFILAFLASMESGAIVVPLDPDLPPKRILELLRDASVTRVITTTEQISVFATEERTWELVTLAELSLRESVWKYEPEYSWKGVILYTSGSTGAPKGVLLSGDMIIREATTLIKRLGIQSTDRVSHLLSPSVIGGLREIFSALLAGALLLPLRVREIGINRLIKQLTDHQVTICRLVSTLFRSLCHGLPETQAWHCRRIYIGGESLLVSDVRLFRKHFSNACRLDHVFGATEFGLCAHYSIPDHFQGNDAETVPIGFTNPGYKLTVVDENGRELERGQTGLLVVAGECIAEGYHTGTSSQDSNFLADPRQPGWRIFRTADLVRINSAGLFEYCGRSDTQTKILGNRVELGAVENCLLSTECLLDAAVVNITRNDRNQLFAVVVRQDATTVSSIDQESLAVKLIEWCKDRLPAAAVPQGIIELASLPKTIQGKCDRKKVRELVEKHFADLAISVPTEVSAVKCSQTQQEILEQLWRKAHQISTSVPLTPTDAFQADSISALEFLLGIRRQLGVEITPAELSFHASAEKLQTLIQSRTASSQNGGADRCLRLSQPFPGPPLFLLHGATGDCAIYHALMESWQAPISVYGVMADYRQLLSHDSLTFHDITRSAVASIQSQQPQGPYLLAGYSYGGILALEVARELLGRGDEVDFCGLIDSFLPLRARYPANWRQWLPAVSNAPVWLLDAIANRQLTNGIARHRAIRNDPTKRIGTITAKADRYKEFIEKMLAAYDQHTISHGAYACSVGLYQARVRPLLHSHRMDRTLQAVTGTKVFVRNLPGNHVTMMARPHVSRLARALGDDLSQTLSKRLASGQ
jgi:acyl-coenzyme A synthetase/AMP-(fatty) acid ligase/thioesterase domain-containing protein/acyl carrier protein